MTMKLKILKSLFLPITAIIFTGCSSSEPDEPISNGFDRNQEVAYPTIEFSPEELIIAEKQNDFGYDFFKKITSLYLNALPNNNVIVSPLSASMVYSMIANSANQELSDVILEQMGQHDLESLNEFNSKLMEYLPVTNAHMSLKLANRIWVDSKYKINDSISALMKANYKFTPENAPLMDNTAEVVKQINTWAYNFTEGQIEKLVKELDIRKKVVPLNAITFNSLWHDKFKINEDQRFNKFDGSFGEEEAEMIVSKTAGMWYREVDGIEIAKIPYIDFRHNFTVVLPPEGTDLKDFLREISANDFNPFDIEFHPGTYHVMMPKLSFNGRTSLIEYNRKYLGLNDSISWENLGINDGPVESSLYQTYSLNTDETGTKAAVVTTETVITAPGPGKPFSINRPFLFFITEQETGSIILAGAINTLKN